MADCSAFVLRCIGCASNSIDNGYNLGQMNTKEKIAVAGFNAFLGLIKSKLKTNKSEQDFQDFAHLSYIQFKQQKVFILARQWIDFHFNDFSLFENGIELK